MAEVEPGTGRASPGGTGAVHELAGPVRAGASTALLAVTLVLMAVNLRAAVASVGPVLRDLQLDLGMSDTLAGVLTTLPVVCFGAFGLLAGRFGRRIGTERALITALVLMTVGPAIRAMAPTSGLLLAASLIPLIGIAIGNILVPVAVKAWFPQDVGRMTGWYSMAIAAGTAMNAALTVPLADAFGGWRAGLGLWAIPAGLALLPWLVIARQRRAARAAQAARDDEAAWDDEAALAATSADDRSRAGSAASVVDPGPGDGAASIVGPGSGDGAASLGVVGRAAEAPSTRPARVAVHRQPKAWALALFFGLQTNEAYTALGWLPAILQDAGLDAQRAGFYLAVAMFIGAPISLVLPRLAARSADQRPWVVGLVLAAAAAYLGLILAPTSAPLLWVLFLGIGLGAFPLALVLIGLRSVTPAGTVALSSLTQGSGYLLAAMGPVAVGAVHDLTGEWTLPLSVILLLLVPKLIFGLIAAKPGSVD